MDALAQLLRDLEVNELLPASRQLRLPKGLDRAAVNEALESGGFLEAYANQAPNLECLEFFVRIKCGAENAHEIATVLWNERG